jgi:hypothetical protein
MRDGADPVKEEFADPHSFGPLFSAYSVSFQRFFDSPDWILIDGFMTQSRVWLLELFRWALNEQEIILRIAR